MIDAAKDSFAPPPEDKTTQHLGLLVFDGYSSLCVSAMVNPLRSANRELGYAAYAWHFLAMDDVAATASDGTRAQATLPIHTTQKFDYLFACAGILTDPPGRKRINAALHRLARQTKVFGALCTGAYMLARAGFLQEHRFTLHWENQPAFSEEFPTLEASRKLYVMDRDVWSGAGGLSSMDLALNIIASDHGHRVAHAVANQYQMDRMRSPDIDQRPFALDELDTLPDSVQRAISVMLVNMESPLPVPDIAAAARMTVRSLERAFRRHLDQSPARFYRKVRLERARQLLWHSNLSVLDVALITGFPSTSHLSRLYQQQFGLPPSAERKTGA